MIFSVLAGSDPVGEFGTPAEAGRAVDAVVTADRSAADELAVIEFDENGERFGEPASRSGP